MTFLTILFFIGNVNIFYIYYLRIFLIFDNQFENNNCLQNKDLIFQTKFSMKIEYSDEKNELQQN